MPVDHESAAVAFARAHAEAWSNYDWAKAREGLAADIYVTATTTLPAARLYLFDEDDKIKAEQIAFFAEPGFRSSGWITGGPSSRAAGLARAFNGLARQEEGREVALRAIRVVVTHRKSTYCNP